MEKTTTCGYYNFIKPPPPPPPQLYVSTVLSNVHTTYRRFVYNKLRSRHPNPIHCLWLLFDDLYFLTIVIEMYVVKNIKNVIDKTLMPSIKCKLLNYLRHASAIRRVYTWTCYCIFCRIYYQWGIGPPEIGKFSVRVVPKNDHLNVLQIIIFATNSLIHTQQVFDLVKIITN